MAKSPWAGGLLGRGMMTAGQSVVVAAGALLAFSVAVRFSGADNVGVLTLLTSISVLGRLFDVSGAGGTARFVAIPSFRERFTQSQIIEVIFLNCLLFNAIICVVLFLVFDNLIGLLFDEAHALVGASLVPYVLATAILSAASYVLASGLDGVGKADERALILSFATVVLVGMTVALVPSLGVVGLAAAQVAQQVCVLILCWWRLRKHVPGLGVVPSSWSWDIVRLVIGNSSRLTVTTALSSGTDPVLKLALNTAGGPAIVATYDLANRFVGALRLVVHSALTPSLPVFAERYDLDKARFQSTLMRILMLMLPLPVLIVLANAVLSPVVGHVAFGHASSEFLFMCAVAGAGVAISVVALPMSFAAQGAGILRWLLVGNTVPLVAAAAMFLAGVQDERLIVVVYASSLAAQSLISIFGGIHQMRIRDGVPTYTGLLLVVALVVACSPLAALWLYGRVGL